jgi:glycosyltransferase involved in cell wall biosynthesis
MPESYKVSIIIPAYNASAYIRETLESVSKQTYSNTETFIIDDGSKDNTVDIIKEYESDKIKLIEQENSGACVARNKGIELSSGDYFQFLDADDVISTDKIEKQIEVLAGSQEYLAVCPTVHFFDGEDYMKMQARDDSFWVYDNDDPVDFLIRLYGGDGKRGMVQTNAWLTPRKIVDSISPWDEKLLLDQDGEYFAKAVLASKGIRTTPGLNYYRRFIRGGNISDKAYKYENLRSALRSLQLKSEYLGKHTQSDRYQQAMSTLFMEIAINAHPVHKDIVNECLRFVRKTGKKPDIPVLGGRAIETVKKTFGWRSAKRLSYMVHKKRR